MRETAVKISYWLRAKVAGANAQGLVVGLSGGIDSACTAALAKMAMGEAVLGVLMPCHSDPLDEEHARLVSEALDIETLCLDLGPVYDLLLTALPPAGQLPAANIKPRLRMTTLYYLAAARSYLVAGTGNKSEMLVGYFTKYGDGGVDLEPLGALFKWQVRELARVLGIPKPIIDRPPSAGLWEGQTDEDEMGLTYGQLDAALAALEAGRTEGIRANVLARVQEMIAGSEHKRHMPPVWKV